MCGAVRFDHPAARNLVAALPDIIRIEAVSAPDMDWMQGTLGLIAAETKRFRYSGNRCYGGVSLAPFPARGWAAGRASVGGKPQWCARRPFSSSASHLRRRSPYSSGRATSRSSATCTQPGRPDSRPWQRSHRPRLGPARASPDDRSRLPRARSGVGKVLERRGIGAIAPQIGREARPRHLPGWPPQRLLARGRALSAGRRPARAGSPRLNQACGTGPLCEHVFDAPSSCPYARFRRALDAGRLGAGSPRYRR